MKIKNPFNFVLGVFCTICFVINLVAGKDAFTVCFSAFAAFINLVIGLTD